MRPIIIIGFSVFPAFVFLSFWCRDIRVTVGTDSSRLTNAGLGGPLHASQRQTLLWSIETHSQTQQTQINFLRCGQAHSFETQRSPGVGLKLCLMHSRGKLWDSHLHTRSLTTEMAVSNSQTWEEGKQTQHVTRLAWRRCPGNSPSNYSIAHAPAPTLSPQIPDCCWSYWVFCCRYHCYNVTRAAGGKDTD